MKKASILIAAAILATASAVKAEEAYRSLPDFTLPSVQFEEIKAKISDNAYSEDSPLPVAVFRRTFKENYDFRTISRGENQFSPLSDLRKMKAVLKSLPLYLDGAGLDFESHRRVLENIADGEHNLDAMLLKYSSGAGTTRAGFLAETGPAMKSFEQVFLALKGNQNGGSYNDNCWSDCVEDCDPTDIGGIVCHISCFYTCETTKP